MTADSGKPAAGAPERAAARIVERHALLGLVLLLAVFLVQTVGPMGLLTASGDETVHLPAGYTYLRTGQVRLNPEHPPLMKEICAAPLLLLRPRLNLADAGWTASPPDQAGFGYRFLYSNDADRLLFWGRMPVVLLGVLLGAYVWRWATDLFGPSAGLLATVLYAFCPNVIAHSRLVTMDLGLSCFLVICLYHAWRHVRGGGRPHLAAAGVALGLALGAKFSGVILLPALVLLVALAVLLERNYPRATVNDPSRARAAKNHRKAGAAAGGKAKELRSWVVAAALLAAMFALAALVVWAIYLFPADPLFYWDGMQQVNKNHRPDYAEYLMGEFEVDGWWYYFPVAMAVKTPLPTLIVFTAALLLWWGRRAAWIDELFVALPALLFLAVTCWLADDIGVRYVLPVYPLLFVFASRLGPVLTGRRSGLVAVGVLAAWLAVGTVRIYPDHLAYFNEIAGGPRGGHRWLDDSNIDWGLDLKRLAAWMNEHQVERIKLLPGPWSGNPAYHGVRWEPVSRDEWRERPLPGVYYAVSTHMLIRGELIARRRGTRNNWLSLYEPVDRVGYSFYLFRFD